MNLKREIVVKDLVTVHYFEFSKDYKFPGEQHDFWELVYVDRGKIIAKFDDKQRTLETGDMIFHKPCQWHSLEADGDSASNVAIITFITDPGGMETFDNKVLSAGNIQKNLISRIIREARAVFKTPLNEIYSTEYIKNDEYSFGAEQLIILYLTELLISIARDNTKNRQSKQRQATSNTLVNSIIEHMDKCISKKLTVNDIVDFATISKSQLEVLFKEAVGAGIIEYFIKMKIDYAKIYIREGNYNLTQIADMLGYESIHYFSRQFKKITGMSPTEYSKSITAMQKEAYRIV